MHYEHGILPEQTGNLLPSQLKQRIELQLDILLSDLQKERGQKGDNSCNGRDIKKNIFQRTKGLIQVSQPRPRKKSLAQLARNSGCEEASHERVGSSHSYCF